MHDELMTKVLRSTKIFKNMLDMLDRKLLLDPQGKIVLDAVEYWLERLNYVSFGENRE